MNKLFKFSGDISAKDRKTGKSEIVRDFIFCVSKEESTARAEINFAQNLTLVSVQELSADWN